MRQRDQEITGDFSFQRQITGRVPISSGAWRRRNWPSLSSERRRSRRRSCRAASGVRLKWHVASFLVPALVTPSGHRVRAPAWSITAHGRCSLNSGRTLFLVETVVECQNGHLIEWLKPTPSNHWRTGGLVLKAVIGRRRPAAAPRPSCLFLSAGSARAPFGGIRQHEHVETGEQH